MTKKMSGGTRIYETNIHNIRSRYKLAVAAESLEAACELFSRVIRSDEWVKQAHFEFQEALCDWSGLTEAERLREPVLAEYEFGWLRDIEEKRYLLQEPMAGHIVVCEQAPTSDQIVQYEAVQCLEGFSSLGWPHRRYDFS
jgi:hypothetical protein